MFDQLSRHHRNAGKGVDPFALDHLERFSGVPLVHEDDAAAAVIVTGVDAAVAARDVEERHRQERRRLRFFRSATPRWRSSGLGRAIAEAVPQKARFRRLLTTRAMGHRCAPSEPPWCPRCRKCRRRLRHGVRESTLPPRMCRAPFPSWRRRRGSSPSPRTISSCKGILCLNLLERCGFRVSKRCGSQTSSLGLESSRPYSISAPVHHAFHSNDGRTG